MIKASLISIIFVLTVIFIFQNQQVFLSEFNLSLDIFFYSFENEIVSNSILIIISFFIGVITLLDFHGNNCCSEKHENN
ncbi:MAG: hypothetical protein ACJ0NN_00085 [Thermodesulfobacteriota bacterium]